MNAACCGIVWLDVATVLITPTNICGTDDRSFGAREYAKQNRRGDGAKFFYLETLSNIMTFLNTYTPLALVDTLPAVGAFT